MEMLAETIRESEELSDLVLNTPPGELRAALSDHPAGPPVLDDFARYSRRLRASDLQP